jgi:hypothetical protein
MVNAAPSTADFVSQPLSRGGRGVTRETMIDCGGHDWGIAACVSTCSDRSGREALLGERSCKATTCRDRY